MYIWVGHHILSSRFTSLSLRVAKNVSDEVGLFRVVAHFDDTSFLCRWTRRVHMKVINAFLNGITYLLWHQSMHLGVLYKRVLTHLCQKESLV